MVRPHHGRSPRTRSPRERVRRIGVLLALAASDDVEYQARVGALHASTKALLGWTIGRNVWIDTRWGGGDTDRRCANTRQNW